MYLRFLELGVRLDAFLFLTAIKLHDQGEGILNRDVQLPVKRLQHDIDEYIAFVEHYGGLHAFDVFHQAYLLQHCLAPDEDIEQFSGAAPEIMRFLRVRKRVEALTFRALENLDYFWYAVEQYVLLGNANVMANVVLHNASKLDALVKELPAVGVYWSPEYIRWCKAVAALGDEGLPEARVA